MTVYSVVYGLDGPGFDSRQGKEIFVFSKMSTPSLRPNLPSYSVAKKRNGCEVVQPLSPSSVEVKEGLELYLRSSYMPSRRAQA